MKKKQILVCGTGFGKIYLKAIAESKEYELMGILGKGSDRSRLLSKNLNVPMYTDIKEINQNVDAACVVVPNAAGGGNGANIAKSILAKGIPTLLEHPAHEVEIVNCIRESGSAAFMLNPFYRYIKPIRDFLEAAQIISKHAHLINALDRIEAVLDEPELPDNGNQHILSQAQPDQPEVQFSDVAFAYQDKEVLHNINFSMQKNTMTALVGPSGGGKSTIANLLARLWDVKSGKVTIRGTDIRDVPLAELMEQISMVFQRVYLFQDTIYNNISMGKPDATEEEVYEAAKKARCYDFIMALPDGFQTVIGEGGATLSGGEKQRISIARCILKDAPIVILDEATASVDTDNESYIQEAINELVKGKTLLVIAHRLNTIRQADQILVISDGRISEQGTHDELMAKAGIYQDFVNIRKKASGWSLA